MPLSVALLVHLVHSVAAACVENALVHADGLTPWERDLLSDCPESRLGRVEFNVSARACVAVRVYLWHCAVRECSWPAAWKQQRGRGAARCSWSSRCGLAPTWRRPGPRRCAAPDDARLRRATCVRCASLSPSQ